MSEIVENLADTISDVVEDANIIDSESKTAVPSPPPEETVSSTSILASTSAEHEEKTPEDTKSAEDVAHSENRITSTAKPSETQIKICTAEDVRITPLRCADTAKFSEPLIKTGTVEDVRISSLSCADTTKSSETLIKTGTAEDVGITSLSYADTAKSSEPLIKTGTAEDVRISSLSCADTTKSSENLIKAGTAEDMRITPLSCAETANSSEAHLRTGTAEDVGNYSVTESLVSETATQKLGKSESPTKSAVTDEGDEAGSSSPTISTDKGMGANYAQHVSYDSDGSAIYTEPQTKCRYKWSTTENNWLPCDAEKNDNKTVSTANPYENDHYKWCSQTQKWIPKVQAQQTTETEHYKWDAEKREWIAKNKIESKSDTTDPENVTYDIDEDGNRIYTDKDGTVFFWDSTKNAWFPKIDDDFMAHYQMNYGFIDNTSASEAEKQRKADEEEKLRELQLQRMTEEATVAAEGNGATAAMAGAKRKAQDPPKWFDLDPEQNTKVYVSNLPLDITMDEFVELMSKCGMIMRDPQTQKYKLKLYAEADGQLKGDGLCDYIKVESVGLALNILDEYNLRGNRIRVQPAKFQMRGEYNPALKPKRKKKDKEKLQKMKEKLFDWRPEKMRGERSKNEKVVIFKNLFDPSIFEKEVELILEYQNELREECSKCGTVRKVVIYDRHPEGIAQVNMADPEEADVVIQMMNGRYFGQRKLSADHWDGKTKYKVIESEAEVQKRLNNWDQYLTQEENERKDDVTKPKDTTEDKALLPTNEEVKDEQCDALDEGAQSAGSDIKVAGNE